jgi:hypothetical protein
MLAYGLQKQHPKEDSDKWRMDGLIIVLFTDVQIARGRAIAQAASRRLLTAETQVQSRMTSSEIRVGRSGTEAGLSPSSLVSFC